MKEPSIVVIGGGTGSYTLLKALKNYTPHIAALVNMADDGGSTGVLRDELGVLPPGDVRQCLVALSDAPEDVRNLFNFRFPKGMLRGHSFGNLFLSAVESMTHDFNEAVRMAAHVLRIRGQVIPVTLDNCQLVCQISNKKIKGEYKIVQATFPRGQKPELSFSKPPRINPAAVSAIQTADLIVIAPGNLYGSLAPVLLVPGLAQALTEAKAKVVYVCNLVNKPKHTPDFAVHDFASEIERFTAPGCLDYVLYNTDTPDKQLLDRYAGEGEYPVGVDTDKLNQASYTSVPGNFLSHDQHEEDENDTLMQRSLIRHDGRAIAKALRQLL